MGKLIYALLEDGLYDPPVVAQDVFIAVRTDSAPGAGTAENPYAGARTGLTDAQNAALFDGVMGDATKVPRTTTVHLGPGTFFTAGFSFDPSNPSTNGGWQPRSALRIAGAGLNETFLKLTNIPANRVAHAIGMDLTSAASYLQGFELSDLTIDPNITSTGNTGTYCGGAISITGRDIYIARVRVQNYGGRISNTSFSVILAGKAKAGQAGEVQNVVVENCIFQNPGDFAGSPSASAKLVAFEGEVSGGLIYSVKSSVIRGCDVDAYSDSIPITAFSPGPGLGVIIEENQVYYCKTGIDLTNTPAQDIIIWDNFFHNVLTGMNFSNSGTGGTGEVKRLVILANTLSLSDNGAARGIVITGSGSSQNFLQLVARRNVIRNVVFGSGTVVGPGISVANVREAIVEDNVINNCSATGSAAAVAYDSSKVQYLKSFNNQSTAGALMRAYDISTSRPLPELTDFAEDSLMAF